MDYAITTAGTATVSELLSTLGVDAAGLKAVWVSLPAAAFVTPSGFDTQVEVAEGTVLRTYDAKSCMADALLAIVQELRLATECTCTFGHEGGYQIATILKDICSKKGKPGDIALMRDLAPVMAVQALCDEGKAIGRAVTQVLDAFSDEIEAHITKKVCPAGSCRAFQTYHVLVSKCTGCGKCLKACADDAILGKPRFVHVIVQKNCVQCDKCRQVCPEKAIVRAGAKKPKTPPKPIPVRRK